MKIQANAKKLYNTVDPHLKSQIAKDRFNGMHCVWQKVINDGLLKASIDSILSLWRKSTSKKSNTYIKLVEMDGQNSIKKLTEIFKMQQLKVT